MKAGTHNHLKTKRLKRLLKLPLYRAVGILESIWLLAIDCADEGDIGKFSDEEIADYLEWDGDASELVQALSDSGWTDPDSDGRPVIHDWLEHCPEYIRDRVRKREARGAKKVKRHAASKKQTTYDQSESDNAGQTRTNAGQDRSTTVYVQPNPTKPNPTNSNPTDIAADAAAPTDAASDEFVAVWNSAKGNHKAGKWTDSRKRALAARLKDPYWRDHWREAIAKFPLKVTASDPDGWKPDVDWFLKPDSVTKILEGKYDWSKSNGKRNEQSGVNYDPAATDATF